MKMNTLTKVRDALKNLSPEVQVDVDLIEKARLPLQRMMKITKGEAVEWN